MSITRPLSRIRSMTSASPVGFGARVTPPAPRVVSAVVLMPLLPAAFPRRIASVRTRPQLLPEDAFERDFEDPPLDFAELDRPPDLDELDSPRLDDRDDEPPPDPRLRLELLRLELLRLELLRLELLFPDAAFDFD